MKIVAQRVFQASVTVEGKVISEIGKGILIYVGFTKGDNKENIQNIANKTLNMRLFEAQQKAWTSSVRDINGEVLVVSQFTLYGFFKGNKPDFHDALGANQAKQLYQQYVDLLRQKYIPQKIKTGQFQAKMIIKSAVDGPVTLIYQKAPGQKSQKQIKEKKEIKEKK